MTVVVSFEEKKKAEKKMAEKKVNWTRDLNFGIPAVNFTKSCVTYATTKCCVCKACSVSVVWQKNVAQVTQHLKFREIGCGALIISEPSPK
jgi:hypothetical protein